jgi:hypothetical protein
MLLAVLLVGNLLTCPEVGIIFRVIIAKKTSKNSMMSIMGMISMRALRVSKYRISNSFQKTAGVGGLLATKATIQNHDFENFHLMNNHAYFGGEPIEEHQAHHGNQEP